MLGVADQPYLKSQKRDYTDRVLKIQGVSDWRFLISAVEML